MNRKTLYYLVISTADLKCFQRKKGIILEMGKMKAEESVGWPRFPGSIGKRTAALCSLGKHLNLSSPQVNAASGTCIVKQVLWS